MTINLTGQSHIPFEDAQDFFDALDEQNAQASASLEQTIAQTIRVLTGVPAEKALAPINADALPAPVARAYTAFQFELKHQAENLAREALDGHQPNFAVARMALRDKLHTGGTPLLGRASIRSVLSAEGGTAIGRRHGGCHSVWTFAVASARRWCLLQHRNRGDGIYHRAQGCQRQSDCFRHGQE